MANQAVYTRAVDLWSINRNYFII